MWRRDPIAATGLDAGAKTGDLVKYWNGRSKRVGGRGLWRIEYRSGFGGWIDGANNWGTIARQKPIRFKGKWRVRWTRL